jgi:hypothetical protein
VNRPHEDLAELVALVRERIGPVAAFKDARVVARLPKTRSGKILRASIRKIADGEAAPVPPTIEDPGGAGGTRHRPARRALNVPAGEDAAAPPNVPPLATYSCVSSASSAGLRRQDASPEGKPANPVPTRASSDGNSRARRGDSRDRNHLRPGRSNPRWSCLEHCLAPPELGLSEPPP